VLRQQATRGVALALGRSGARNIVEDNFCKRIRSRGALASQRYLAGIAHLTDQVLAGSGTGGIFQVVIVDGVAGRILEACLCPGHRRRGLACRGALEVAVRTICAAVAIAVPIPADGSVFALDGEERRTVRAVGLI